MFSTLVKKMFGSRNERVLKRMQKIVEQISALEPQLEALTDEQLAASTEQFKQRIANGEFLEQLLPEAFAVVREVSKRTIGLRHFDVQLVGGMVLHGGNIAEMRTGEGKTLVSTLPAYLNALSGKGVHIVTVNDYLAKRDSDWMKPIYDFLGLSVGVIVPDMPLEEKKAAYAKDITYGTNNEFGFDYLRDNMAFSLDEKVQRELNFAIVDEVDSILIDEARTPLIISGAAENSSEAYISINRIIPSLHLQKEGEESGDYTLDEKQKQAHLTEAGHQHVEQLLIAAGLLNEGESLYSASNISLMHHVSAALRAHALYQKNVEYIVANNEVVIVDEHTGRTMPGRRWSDGLHQAMEAKEGVAIQSENQTLASITFQNFFRLYTSLSGMTGTADTEAYEFQQIYNLEVVVMPTNRPMQRKDFADKIYLNQKEKYLAIIEDIKMCKKNNQPVLVGTASIESSELLSQLLTKGGIKHQVLNAKFHEKEAQIIAHAGKPGSVTIATNMAGRGTDIVLGGSLDAELAELADIADGVAVKRIEADWHDRHQQVLAAGGLRIIGSERHESRRIDNQLRGRAGRQGDPGSSCFYLSLEDNLMRIFASERIAGLMQRLGMKEGESIEHPWVNKAIENAQRKVEGHHFDVRKQLLEYDNVANDQRKVIYQQRADIMAAENLTDMVDGIRESVFETLIHRYVAPESMEDEWDLVGLEEQLKNDFSLSLPFKEWQASDIELNAGVLIERAVTEGKNSYAAKVAEAGADNMTQFEKSVLLQTLDNHWRDHLSEMDQLRQCIHLRGYAQKDPKQEYKREAFELFSSMLDSLKYDVMSLLCCVEIRSEEDIDAVEEQRRSGMALNYNYQHASFSEEEVAEENGLADTVVPFRRDEKKVGRNESCPCGSGKKYKLCHGRL